MATFHCVKEQKTLQQHKSNMTEADFKANST